MRSVLKLSSSDFHKEEPRIFLFLNLNHYSLSLATPLRQKRTGHNQFLGMSHCHENFWLGESSELYPVTWEFPCSSLCLGKNCFAWFVETNHTSLTDLTIDRSSIVVSLVSN